MKKNKSKKAKKVEKTEVKVKKSKLAILLGKICGTVAGAVFAPKYQKDIEDDSMKRGKERLKKKKS